MRKKSVGNNRQTIHQRGNQRDGSPHYVLLYSDDESGDEEEILLQPRNKSNSTPRRIEVIVVTLKPEDTLQALALRYRCTISELKRINNIHKENEIFARRVIKVPVPPFSIFTENNDTSDNLIDINPPENNENESPNVKREEEIINLISTPTVVPSTSTDINSVILNSVCEPLASGIEQENCCDGEDDTLLRERTNATAESRVVDTFKCSGADWGLSWIHLLAFSLLLGCAGPVIYIYCIAESEHNHEPT
ncbi:lysM and putative peptidoglycan-binding domain-containing protein 3 [Diachasma alloeum]|uniref:lysM and putative peptidoglycan-binding domain-containing protein 3 n=1 Tax=Diachasma alloeum TaxID=454923 RepID=UPI0007384FA5|nr:lysM and putative peptidoglycan-binding domain-containing protein 3 [Diachasma alloeum]